GDQERAGELALAIPGPAAADQEPQRGAARVAVEIESVGGRERAEAPGEVTDRFIGLESDDRGEVRVIGDERYHGPLGDVDELCVGVAARQCPDERRGAENGANGTDAHPEDAQHVAKVSLALPGSASRA